MLVPTIGVEVHVELKSKTKVFSNSKNAYSNIPNEFVNVVDLGYPGTLPILNREVVDMALRAALVLNCKINKEMHFDRKNYFYPDLPKGYQITQADTPIGYDGYLEIEVNGKKKKIGIERIHIEEDTCKSIHSVDETLLNFNRSGVPLIEIVSKAEISSSEEAVLYLEALREVLLYLGISDVKIEEGSMRCDANVSLSEENSAVLGTKTEIKNIGSISNVGTSILYEMERQKHLLEKGEKIREETRRFDDKSVSTILMRKKETVHDYRYFPEPDLPYVFLTEEEIRDTQENLPVLPNQLREKYRNANIGEVTIRNIIANLQLCYFLEEIFYDVDPIIASNLLTGDISAYLNKNNISLKQTKITKQNFIDLVKLIKDKDISIKQAKEIIPVMLEENMVVTDYVSEKEFKQISSEDELLEIIEKVILENPNSIKDYKEGKDRAIKFLMGQVMKVSKGKASPNLANQLLKEKLSML